MPGEFKFYKVDKTPVSEKYPNLKKKAVLISDEIFRQSKDKPMENPASLNDPLMYVFTSGTTGLPKAATIKHSRLVQASFWHFFFCMMKTLGCFLDIS